MKPTHRTTCGKGSYKNIGMNNVPVLDQGRHGSCATFAATGALDAALTKPSGELGYISQLCNLDLGNYVVLINARYIAFTGNSKLDKKKYYNHSGYPGGLRTRSTRLMQEKYSQELVFRIIRGMMPHTKLGDKQAERLFIFDEEEMINKNKKKILQAQAKNFIKINLPLIHK